MMNILLFVHIVIAILLIAVILLQQTGTDGLSGIGGGNNMGMVTARSAANFLTRTTIVLATLFFINAIVLANMSSKKQTDIDKKINESSVSKEANIPIAK